MPEQSVTECVAGIFHFLSQNPYTVYVKIHVNNASALHNLFYIEGDSFLCQNSVSS